MKYLPKETCEYLVSLGCVSESGYYFLDGELVPDFEEWHEARFNSPTVLPAFSLEDILRKDSAEKIWPKSRPSKGMVAFEDATGDPYWEYMTEKVVQRFQSHPDAWPEEVAKLIKP